MKKIFFLIVVATALCMAQNELVDTLSNAGDSVAVFNLKQQIDIPIIRAEKLSGDQDTLKILTGKIIRNLSTNAALDTMWSVPIVRDSNFTVVSTLLVPTGAYGRSWAIVESYPDLVKVWMTDVAGDATRVSIQGKVEK